MTEPSGPERALRASDAFEPDGDGFAVPTTAFAARVVVEETDDQPRYRVTVRVPTLDAVVVGETVAPVVQDGWLETFTLRLEDVGGVTRSSVPEPTVAVDEAAGEVVVETAVPADPPSRGAEDAKAVVDYVEGTYVEGIIPGYTYRDPVDGLIDRARSMGER